MVGVGKHQLGACLVQVARLQGFHVSQRAHGRKGRHFDRAMWRVKGAQPRQPVLLLKLESKHVIHPVLSFPNHSMLACRRAERKRVWTLVRRTARIIMGTSSWPSVPQPTAVGALHPAGGTRASKVLCR